MMLPRRFNGLAEYTLEVSNSNLIAISQLKSICCLLKYGDCKMTGSVGAV